MSQTTTQVSLRQSHHGAMMYCKREEAPVNGTGRRQDAGRHRPAEGDVRGSCGHAHRTPEAAAACAERDARAVKRGYGKNAGGHRRCPGHDRAPAEGPRPLSRPVSWSRPRA
jgi:hypothetical protein